MRVTLTVIASAVLLIGGLGLVPVSASGAQATPASRPRPAGTPAQKPAVTPIAVYKSPT